MLAGPSGNSVAPGVNKGSELYAAGAAAPGGGTATAAGAATAAAAAVVAVVAFLPTVGPISFSPELALVVGNLVLAPFAQRQKLILKLGGLRKITSSIYEFSFPKPVGFIFKAGQYLEWMVPHKKAFWLSLKNVNLFGASLVIECHG